MDCDPLLVTPTGFNGGKENRITVIGHANVGVNKADIIMEPEDHGIAMHQAQILSKPEGYFL